MKTRKINITIKLEDNDLVQFNLEKSIYNLVGENNITDFRVLPNTEHLKDNEHFKALYKEEKKAKDLKYKFINENRR